MEKINIYKLFDRPKQYEVAQHLGVTPDYLRTIAYGLKRPSVPLALKIIELAPEEDGLNLEKVLVEFCKDVKVKQEKVEE